jgi:hypothetical protein
LVGGAEAAKNYDMSQCPKKYVLFAAGKRRWRAPRSGRAPGIVSEDVLLARFDSGPMNVMTADLHF